jgi:hypothetical protein
LLVYFFRRIKTGEKEAEEDWTLARRSLFVNPEPVGQKTEEVAGAGPSEADAVNQAATRELASIRTGEIHEVTGGKVAQEPPATEPLRAEHMPSPKTRTPAAPIIKDAQTLPRPSMPGPPPEARPTEVLASPQPEHVSGGAEAIDEAGHFDDDVWAGLEMNEQQSSPPAQQAGADQHTQLLGSAELWPATERPSTERAGMQQPQPPVESAEPQLDARIEGRAGREPFEPPRVERVSHRDPFEPPVIKPLTPREESTFIERQGISPATDDLYASSPRDRKGPVTYGSNVDRAPSQDRRPDAQDLYEDVARRVESTEPSNVRPASADRADRAVEPSIAASQVGRRSPAGSVLGLPAEASHGPLILGDPVRSKEEMGIGALSNYGRPAEKDGGRGGTVVLLVVVLIIGGGLLSYLLIPSVHSRANAWVEHLRGIDVEKARVAAMTPKAVIYPRINSEVNKNQVKVKALLKTSGTSRLKTWP